MNITVDDDILPGMPGMPGAIPGQPIQPFHPMVGAWPGQAVRMEMEIPLWNQI